MYPPCSAKHTKFKRLLLSTRRLLKCYHYYCATITDKTTGPCKGRRPVMRLKCVHTFIFLNCLIFCRSYGQKINGEIFIPLDNRSEIWLKPQIDTLINQKEYIFRIRVSKEYTISQFLFEKGLAVQTDSVLIITANSQKWGDIDTATLRVIVTSIGGSRIFLFQKQFMVKVPEKSFPIINHPKTNVIMVNDKTRLDRNESYPKSLFVEGQPFLTMYDNEISMKKLDVKGVTVSLMKKEGKQYISTGDTISTDALHELKKVRKPIPVYIRVDALAGKTKKAIWERIIIYPD